MQTILLLDSCTLTRECLTTILRAKGYRVQSTAMIAQAKTMIAKRPPDLIITEVRLPDDNVLNLMRSLKADPNSSKIKVCLLTQAAAKKPIMEAIGLGACKVMLKSKFTVAGFIEQVAAICDAAPAQATPDADTTPAVELRYPLPMPDQDPALALKEIKPIIARTALKDRLDEMEELRTIPNSITKILEAVDSPESKIEDVADLLKMDQTIAMKIMRVANSIEYARGEQVTTLKDAVIRIGLQELRELIAGIEIIDQNLCGLDQKLFWDHALSVAVCSAKIAGLSEDIDPELAFTAAVLHDIGRVILQQALPTEYQQVLDTSFKLGVSLELVEKRLLLSDHTSIAQTMLHSWNLPKDLVDAIANHHCPANNLSKMCPKNTKIAAIIELSNRIIHAMGVGSSGNKVLSSTEELFELIEIEGMTVESIIDGLEDQINTMRAHVYPSEDVGKPSLALSRADTPVFDRVFNPIFISMDADFDAIGHWVMSNADDSSDETTPPNIAIIHARQPKDKQELSDKLEAALLKFSFDSSSQTIPLLILSPSGKTALPDEVLMRHPSKILMSPFSTLHFEQSVNHLLNGLVRAEEPRRAA
ncbi:MAG: response regulator [Phycisphaerales bacterium]|nr:response regulator [Phycisphaerales bacterium]